ncbi:DUF4394 domain-containing protein [Hymenobacter sp. HD11105]
MQLPLLPSSPVKQHSRRAPWILGAALGLCLGAAAPGTAQTVYGLSPTGLVTFNAATPATVTTAIPFTGVTTGQTLVGLDVRPNTGQLFALGYNAATTQAQLYTINPTTGAATTVGVALTLALGTATDRIGFDFNPTVDRIRVVSSNRANFRLNPNNGTIAATDGTLTYAATDANTAQTPGVGAVAYTNSYIGTGSTTLYGIDEINNRLVTQNPPNEGILNTVGTGALGVTTNGLTQSADIDIYFNPTSRVDQAYLLINSTTAPASNQLYTLNLTTGVASAPVTIGSGALGITDIAIGIDRTVSDLQQRLVYAYQVVGTATNLLSFDSARPSVIRSITGITGLTAGQTLVGIDARPNTGQLFGLGYDASLAAANARLYIINTTTGVATPVGTEATTLALGTATDRVGFDFNPVADRIRVVSTNRANYRLNPIDGTIVDNDPNTPGIQRDGDVNFGPNTGNTGVQPSIVAAAYTNPFLGSTATTLYVFDNSFNQIFSQDPPNAGVLDAAGPPTGFIVNRAAGVGFDVHAENATSNFVLLAAALGTSTNANLYDVNLGSGGATLIGAIGLGVPVNGIAFAITGTVLSNNKASEKVSAQVEVFPNPATNMVSINLPASLSKQSVEATLVNALGQSVLRRTLSARDGSSKSMSLNGVAKGVYMLQLSTSEGVVSKRLIVR